MIDTAFLNQCVDEMIAKKWRVANYKCPKCNATRGLMISQIPDGTGMRYHAFCIFCTDAIITRTQEDYKE